MYSPADIKIYNVKTKETVEEKALLAFDLNTKKIIAFGNEVYNNLENYNTGKIAVVSPFNQGLVDDFTVAEKFMHWIIARAYGKKLRGIFYGGKKIAVILSAPQGEVQLKAIQDMFYISGASEVLIEYKSNIGENCRYDDVTNYMLQKDRDIALVIEIGKENPEEYVKESIDELMEKARFWGVEKEEVLSIMQQAIEKDRGIRT